ncbi:nucleotidyltransferase family protein [Sediminicola sp. 1XM1-17]|uniref:nucleotidyltransferase family protein n=1 Tax=Sediminicola sp. 1XM1-17 TaxID=3127702 RepID=UPI00307864DE
MEKKMTLLLMAAGKGSRYGKLKQFDGLGPKDEFLMEFSMYDAIKVGFNHIVVITQRNHVQFLKEHLEGRLPEHIALDVLSQELEELPKGVKITGKRSKPWGTAHAVWTARNHIDSPFAVLNADDFYGSHAFKEAADFINDSRNNSTFAMIGYTLEATLSQNGSVSRGICSIKNGKLSAVEERLKIISENGSITDLDSGEYFTGKEMVSMNFWICHPSLFSEITEYFTKFLLDEELVQLSEVYLPLVIQHLIAKNKISVKVLPSGGKWFGITYADDRESAVGQLMDMTTMGNYPSPLWNKLQ